MVLVKEGRNKGSRRKDLSDKIIQLARDMFGTMNVGVGLGYPNFHVEGVGIVYKYIHFNKPEIFVTNQRYYDDAIKFAQRLESEVFRKKDSVVLIIDHEGVHKPIRYDHGWADS